MQSFRLTSLFVGAVLLFAGVNASAEALKPFVLGDTPAGDMAPVVEATKKALTANGFQVVGSYSPFSTATVICATNPELLAAAVKAKNGGFGVAQRVAVTDVKGKLQVSYVNPAYIGTAYGLGKLDKTTEALKAALGHKQEFGSKGVEEELLKPGVYHYSFGMPYFHNIDDLAEYPDHKTAVEKVEAALAAGKGGTQKVYRVDLPNEVVVFGVAINKGDGVNKGAKDTDKEILDIIDFQDPRSTAYLPYEMMVAGKKVVSLRGRFRIAVMFPDLSMMGAHGFSKIMSAPGGIKDALMQAAGGTLPEQQ